MSEFMVFIHFDSCHPTVIFCDNSGGCRIIFELFTNFVHSCDLLSPPNAVHHVEELLRGFCGTTFQIE